MKIWKLNNGLNIGFKNNSQNEILSMGLFIKLGSQNENIENNGITHLLEHFLSEKFVEENKLIGAFANAVTTKEYMCFFVKGIVKDFEKILSIFKETIILKENFSKANTIFKEVVLREIAQFNSSVENTNLSKLFKLYFGEDTLALNVMGDCENINKITFIQLEKHYRDYFTPDNAAMSIVGNLEMEMVYESVEKFFCSWEGNAKKYLFENFNKNERSKFEFQNIETNKAIIDICFNGLKRNDSSINSFKIANKILGEGSTSYINRLVRQKHGYSYLPYSSLISFERKGLLHIHAETIDKYLNDTLNLITEIIINIKNRKFESSEIILAKRDLVNENIFNYESNSAQMTCLGQKILFSNNLTYNFEEELKTVSDKEIHKTICEAFSDYMCIVVGSNRKQVWMKEIEYLMDAVHGAS